MKKRIHLTVGTDFAGDACIYIQELKPDSDPLRYLDHEEIEALLPKIAESIGAEVSD